MTAKSEQQLDEIEGGLRPIGFCERLYPRTDAVGSVLHKLYQGLRANEVGNLWLEDQFHILAQSLVELSGIVRSEIDQIAAHRKSTREELYRRLHRGRDYLSACYAQPVTVAQVAAVATLSPFHFHRQFKAVFHQTPMQFVQACRLQAARRLLATTDLPVTQICFSVGFESLGSFSSLFSKRFALSPLRYRNQIRKR
jgi:AraC-like DNA-binding protein